MVFFSFSLSLFPWLSTQVMKIWEQGPHLVCESQSQLHTQSLGIHKQLILMLSWMHSVYVGAGRGPRAALLITTVGVDRMDAGCLRTIFSPLPILASPSPCISIGGPQEPLPVTVCLHDNELLEENRAFPFSEKTATQPWRIYYAAGNTGHMSIL